MARDIVLIVGNGITIDACQRLGIFDQWNPSSPTKWGFSGHEEKLPRLAKFIASCPYTQENDFHLFEAMHLTPKEPIMQVPMSMDFYNLRKKLHNKWLFGRNKWLSQEARLFLMMAFSRFQNELEANHLNQMKNWQWTEWLLNHKDRISAVVSFNYDMVFEKALTIAGINFAHINLNSRVALSNCEVIVHKPHSSINYDINGVSIPITLPLGNEDVFGNDCDELKLISVSEEPRIRVDAILPGEALKRSYMWIESGKRAWEGRCQDAKHIVLAGLSYWECDREEIDGYVNCLNKDTTKIYMANPSPEKLWCDNLKHEFGEGNFHEWKGCPENIELEIETA